MTDYVYVYIYIYILQYICHVCIYIYIYTLNTLELLMGLGGGARPNGRRGSEPLKLHARGRFICRGERLRGD